MLIVDRDQHFLDLVLGAVGEVLRGSHVSESATETLPTRRMALFLNFGLGGMGRVGDACQGLLPDGWS